MVHGWAIPAATDIAFAIGVLAILGRYAPPSIKVLLVTIAIVDDIGAVLVIALFYTSELNIAALGGALILAGLMTALGRYGVRRLWPFIAGFALMWVLMLASGVHATIAGVLAALTIPLGQGEEQSPLKRLEHAIHPWVMFGVVPIFGLVSAGVHLTGGIGPPRRTRSRSPCCSACSLGNRSGFSARLAWRCEPALLRSPKARDGCSYTVRQSCAGSASR